MRGSWSLPRPLLDLPTLDSLPYPGLHSDHMKTSQTTLFGSLAAVGVAAQEIPGLPHWAQVCLTLGGAFSLARLGWSASDCPAGCQGTDQNGRRLGLSRFASLMVQLLIILGMAAVLFTGCVTATLPSGVGSDTNTVYTVSPTLSTVSNTTYQAAEVVSSVIPETSCLPSLIAGVFGVIAAISGWVARHKSQVASTLAKAVVSSGPETIDAVGTALTFTDKEDSCRAALGQAASTLTKTTVDTTKT